MKNITNQKLQQGFTLIELMIVVIVQAHVIFPAPDDAVGVRVAVISPTAVASIPSPVQSGIVPPTV
jgi:hypothetical protein